MRLHDVITSFSVMDERQLERGRARRNRPTETAVQLTDDVLLTGSLHTHSRAYAVRLPCSHKKGS